MNPVYAGLTFYGVLALCGFIAALPAICRKVDASLRQHVDKALEPSNVTVVDFHSNVRRLPVRGAK